MKQHIENTRRQLGELGELGAMASQNEAMERKILARAQHLLTQIEGSIDNARADAMAHGDDAKQRYSDMVEERGRLQQVIAQANAVLSGQ